MLARVWGPLIGPLVAVLSFVCSVGNVPLAAVLWNGGISFGGVIAFLFADLLILPILNIYRKYYGLKVAAILAGVFYLAMAGAALVVEALFGALHLIPTGRQVMVMQDADPLELHQRAEPVVHSRERAAVCAVPEDGRAGNAARDGRDGGGSDGRCRIVAAMKSRSRWRLRIPAATKNRSRWLR